MRTQSSDTNPEIEKRHIKLLRQAGLTRRAAMLRNLTLTTRKMAWQSLVRSRPHLSLAEKKVFFIELIYGKPVAQGIKTELLRTGTGLGLTANPNEETENMDADILAAIAGVVAALEKLGINYLIGGSVASSVHGLPRSTQDADLVADIKTAQVTELAAQLENRYYLDETALREAVQRRSSFNLIDQQTLLKVDIFVLKEQPFNQVSFSRRQETLVEQSFRPFQIYTPEDILLQKLVWFQAGGQVSERQWLDVLGILKMQEHLDRPYLEEWANRLNLAGLLAKAWQEAGLS